MWIKPRHAVAALVALTSISAHAEWTRAYIATNFLPEVQRDVYDPAGPIALSGTMDYPGNGSSSGDIYLSPNYGSLKASAGVSNTGIAGGGIFAYASFLDGLTINSPGRDGQGGKLTARFSYDWSLNTSGGINAVSGAQFTARLGSAEGYSREREQFDCSSGPCHTVRDLSETTIYDMNGPVVIAPGPLQPYFDLTTNFVFGEEFALHMALTVDASVTSAYEFPGGSARTDAAHSAYWGGLLSVFDDAGSPIGYSIGSSSGTDYSRSFVPVVSAVPEPSSFVLASVGLAAVFLGAKRGRRNPVS